MRKRSGFTLIELLVVVAIIVVLIALLIPSLGRAKRISRGVVCLTHLRQIGLGFNAYAVDYGILPIPYVQLTAPTRDMTWETSLWMYVTNIQLTSTQMADTKHAYLASSTFVCPEGQLDVTTGDYQSMGYAMNECLPDAPRARTFGLPPPERTLYKQLKPVVNPSRTLLASDGTYPSVSVFSAGDKDGITTMSGSADVFDQVAHPNQQNRHSLCVNCAMADGSARPWQWIHSNEIPVPPPGAAVGSPPSIDLCSQEVQIFWRGYN